MISKELLSEVFPLIDIEKSYFEKEKLYYCDIYGYNRIDTIESLIPYFQLWASLIHNFSICSYFSKIDNGWLLYCISEIPYGMEITNKIDGKIYENPLFPITEICQLILENKENQ